jgi:anti-sigma regulatory factor (Ser/Thr protein kinase)
VRAGLVEALGNAIIHGALGVSYEGRAAGDIEASLDAIDRASAALAGCASVRVEIKTDSAGTAIVITDPGPGFDWRASPSSGGLGLTIMRSVFCAIHWNAEGNVVSLGLAPPST